MCKVFVVEDFIEGGVDVVMVLDDFFGECFFDEVEFFMVIVWWLVDVGYILINDVVFSYIGNVIFILKVLEVFNVVLDSLFGKVFIGECMVGVVKVGVM